MAFGNYMTPSNLIAFMHSIHLPLNVEELLEIMNSSPNTCMCIKNERSAYQYANDNFVQLMGLDNLSQLLRCSDFDLSKNKQDAYKYQELDRYVIEEGKTLAVCETLTPSYNPSIIKTMQGKIFPLFGEEARAHYVLTVVSPQSNLMKLDWDTVFTLTKNELDELLKRRYTIKLTMGSVVLSKMEIQTLIQLLKGANAGEIAQALYIKQTTVESYLVNIRNKLGVSSRSELISFVIREQLLQKIIL